MKRWKTAVPLLTLVGILVGFFAKRALAPVREEIVIRPPPAALIPPLELPARDRALSGSVVAPGGAPVPDALVWLRAGDEPHWAYTDAQGRFELLALEPGPWLAKVIARGFDPVALEIPDSAAAHTVELGPPLAPAPALPPLPRADLTGRIGSRLPVDLEGAEVLLTPVLPPQSLNAPLPRVALARADGRFEVEDLFAGDYQVEVRPAWARGGSWPDLARALEAAEATAFSHGGSGEVRELSIELATGEAHGTLADLHGSPVEGAMILVSAAADESRVWPPARSSADGSFAVDGLPSGRYLLSIRAGSGAAQQEIEIRAGERLELVLAPLEVRRSR